MYKPWIIGGVLAAAAAEMWLSSYKPKVRGDTQEYRKRLGAADIPEGVKEKAEDLLYQLHRHRPGSRSAKEIRQALDKLMPYKLPEIEAERPDVNEYRTRVDMTIMLPWQRDAAERLLLELERYRPGSRAAAAVMKALDFTLSGKVNGNELGRPDNGRAGLL